MNNKLKIISGKYKSRIISIPNTPYLKPTKAYIRENLFNVINLNRCKSVLDLFSGSGILSIEAFSRGIKDIVLIEKDVKLVSSIKSNLSLLGENNIKIINDTVESFLKYNKKKSFDIIFIDAPFDTNLLKETLILLRDNKYLDTNTFMYYEYSKKDKNDYKSYIKMTHNILKDLSIGDVSYTISINKNK